MNERIRLLAEQCVGSRPYNTFDYEKFAALVAAAERERVAAWMMERGYATGHGDTVEDLLKELEWQIREQEREARAKKQEFVCSTGFCRFTLTQTGVGINVPDEEKCKK